MSEKQDIVILGTRVFAEEVADLIGDCDEYRLAAFGENLERERCGGSLHGLPIIWVDDLAPLAATHQAVCAIGSTRRHLFVKQVEGLGFRFATIRHPIAHVSRTATVEAGTILSAGVIIASHARLGRHIIANRGSLIGHHTVIGDYVTISPGANIAGCVTVGERTYVGMGAIILERINIGVDSVIGAGAVVTRDVPDNVHVQGVPARVAAQHIEER
jgi:sugar O-acyltransferase (sialic acid O-acetyltransferase NeuD family)